MKIRAVGSAHVASNPAIKHFVEDAMVAALQEAYARGITDDETLRQIQREAAEAAQARLVNAATETGV